MQQVKTLSGVTALGSTRATKNREFAYLRDTIFNRLDEADAEPEVVEVRCETAISSPSDFNSLPPAEGRVLAAGYLVNLRECRPFDGKDILVLTDKLSGKAMPLVTTYRAIGELVSKGLINRKGVGLNINKRASEHYEVTENGRRALVLALHLSDQLEVSQMSAAA
jgi:hypothetical protein